MRKVWWDGHEPPGASATDAPPNLSVRSFGDLDDKVVGSVVLVRSFGGLNGEVIGAIGPIGLIAHLTFGIHNPPGAGSVAPNDRRSWGHVEIQRPSAKPTWGLLPTHLQNYVLAGFEDNLGGIAAISNIEAMEPWGVGLQNHLVRLSVGRNGLVGSHQALGECIPRLQLDLDVAAVAIVRDQATGDLQTEGGWCSVHPDMKPALASIAKNGGCGRRRFVIGERLCCRWRQGHQALAVGHRHPRQ